MVHDIRVLKTDKQEKQELFKKYPAFNDELEKALMNLREGQTLGEEEENHLEYRLMGIDEGDVQTALGVTVEWKGWQGTVLGYVVTLGDQSLAESLLDKRALLETPAVREWKDKNTKKKHTKKVRRSIIFFAVERGDLDTLKMLLKRMMEGSTESHRQDFWEATVPGKRNEPEHFASIFWEAANSGHLEVLDYLSQHENELRVDQHSQRWLETMGRSPGDADTRYTPLHIAALRGHHVICAYLLHQRANPGAHSAVRKSGSDWEVNEGRSALRDAIASSHRDVVKVLIDSGARFINQEDCLCELFETRETATIAACAQGVRSVLSKDPTIIENFDDKGQQRFLDTIEMFLRSDGDAPSIILEAIFQKCALRCWLQDESNNKLKSRNLKSAAISGLVNFAVGRPFSEFQRFFDEYTAVDDEDKKLLIDRLVPEAPGRMKVPIDIFQCMISRLHENIRMLHSISAIQREECFEHSFCVALINFWWEKYKRLFHLNLAINVIQAIAFLVITCFLGYSIQPGTIVRDVGLGTICILEIFALLRELAQMRGLCVLLRYSNTFHDTRRDASRSRDSWYRAYFLDVKNFTDFVGLLLGVCAVTLLYIFWGPLFSMPSFVRVELCTVALFRWLRVIQACQCLEIWALGEKILPIIRALSELRPFAVVLFCSLVGCAQAYQTLAMQDGKDLLLNWLFGMYRLGVMGEMDMIFPESSEDAVEEISVGLLVRFMLVLVTFVMNVALLNIFIAVLTESYSSAHAKRTQLFYKERAEIVRDIAVQVSVFGGHCLRCHKRKQTRNIPGDGNIKQHRQIQRRHQQEQGAGEEHEAGDYFWYCSECINKGDQLPELQLEQLQQRVQHPLPEQGLSISRANAQLRPGITRDEKSVHIGVATIEDDDCSVPPEPMGDASVGHRESSTPPEPAIQQLLQKIAQEQAELREEVKKMLKEDQERKKHESDKLNSGLQKLRSELLDQLSPQVMPSTAAGESTASQGLQQLLDRFDNDCDVRSKEADVLRCSVQEVHSEIANCQQLVKGLQQVLETRAKDLNSCLDECLGLLKKHPQAPEEPRGQTSPAQPAHYLPVVPTASMAHHSDNPTIPFIPSHRMPNALPIIAVTSPVESAQGIMEGLGRAQRRAMNVLSPDARRR